MPVYIVANHVVNDPQLLEEYLQTAGSTMGTVPVKVLAADLASKPVEGTPRGARTVILEFESEEDFRTWYDSPGYQAAVGKRLAATDGFSVLVQGL